MARSTAAGSHSTPAALKRRLAARRLFNAQFLDPVPQRAKGHAQKLCSGGLVVARLLQRAQDRFTLNVLKLLAERLGTARGRRGRLCGRGGAGRSKLQISGFDPWPATQRQSPFKNVFQ